MNESDNVKDLINTIVLVASTNEIDATVKEQNIKNLEKTEDLASKIQTKKTSSFVPLTQAEKKEIAQTQISSKTKVDETTIHASSSSVNFTSEQLKSMVPLGMGYLDQSGVLYLQFAQLNDLYVEATVSLDQKAYIPYNVAKRYGLTDQRVKMVNVEGLILPVEEISKKGFNQQLKEVNKAIRSNKHLLHQQQKEELRKKEQGF